MDKMDKIVLMNDIKIIPTLKSSGLSYFSMPEVNLIPTLKSSGLSYFSMPEVNLIPTRELIGIIEPHSSKEVIYYG